MALTALARRAFVAASSGPPGGRDGRGGGAVAGEEEGGPAARPLGPARAVGQRPVGEPGDDPRFVRGQPRPATDLVATADDRDVVVRSGELAHRDGGPGALL